MQCQRCRERIAINTDKQHLDMVQADKRCACRQVTHQRALGPAGSGRPAGAQAEMARPTLEGLLCDAEPCLHHCRYGWRYRHWDGTCRCADCKEQGAIVVGMVSYPFQVEKARLFARVEDGLESLSTSADSVIRARQQSDSSNTFPNLPLGPGILGHGSAHRGDRQGHQ